jgi:hypothetical protein
MGSQVTIRLATLIRQSLTGELTQTRIDELARIDAVYLFDAIRLRIELGERGVKISEATSVRAAHWDEAEIYPRSNNPLLVVSERQRHQLAMFRGGD